MMLAYTTPTVETVTRPPAGEDDNLTHGYCSCTPDVSLCGLDISGLPDGDAADPADLCVVCADLYDQPCPRCGAT